MPTMGEYENIITTSPQTMKKRREAMSRNIFFVRHTVSDKY